MLAVDVYALGVIMWQLWFRASPFAGKSIHAVISAVMRGKRPVFKATDRQLLLPPEPLRDLIVACWSQEVDDRPTVQAAADKFADAVVPAVEALQAKPLQGISTGARQQSGAAKATLATSTMNAFSTFLATHGLEKYEEALKDHGYADLETVCDRELLDDGTLAAEIGMTKLEIRKLRAVIETKGYGPTMMKKKRQVASMAKSSKSGAKAAAHDYPTPASPEQIREEVSRRKSSDMDGFDLDGDGGTHV